jgi:hypothetical protein
MGVQAPAGAHTITVTVTDAREINRWWGLPFVGMVVRYILTIPHILVLYLLGIGMFLWFIVSWLVILLLGKVPEVVVKLMTESLQRSYRAAGYVILLPSDYPPLEPGPSQPVPVAVDIDDTRISRLWGIPLVGGFVRGVVLIPHFFILSFLGVALGGVALLVWIPILVNGRYPDLAARILKVAFGYGARVGAYAMFMPVPYPPFSFD